MTLITKIPGTPFTGAAKPKLYREPLINAGTLYCYDFLDPYTNPGADGVFLAGTALNSLGPAAGTGTVTGSAGIANLAGKAGLSMPGAGGGTVSIGSNGQYDLSSTNAEFLVILWLKLPADYLTTNYLPVAHNSTGATNPAQWWLDLDWGGKTPRFSVGTGAGAYSLSAGASLTVGAPAQVAMRWKSTGLMEVHINAALSSAVATAGPKTLQSAATTVPKLRSDIKGTIYRLYQENLSISGKSAAAQIAADYAANVGRFV